MRSPFGSVVRAWTLVFIPEKPARASKPRKKTKREKEDREEIFEALEKLGHEPFYHVLDGSLQSLHAVAKCGADLIFNLTEAFAGDDTKEMNVAAYLDLLDLPFTGGGPHATFLAQDKATAKKMFAFHGIRTPYFATAYRGRVDHAHDISFPLIVKPMLEDGSIGIDSESVVSSIKELMERVEYLQNEFDSAAIIEEYIEGREIYAAILGSYEHARVLPLVELDLSRLPKGTPKIASWDVKFEKDTEVHRLTKSAVAENLDEEISFRPRYTFRRKMWPNCSQKLPVKSCRLPILRKWSPSPGSCSGKNFSRLISDLRALMLSPPKRALSS